MPQVAADSLLPFRPRRVLVAGTSGAGKTTLARRIAAILELPHSEIDALFHGPNWVPRPEFVSDVEAAIAAERWVTEWQYRLARPLLAERADTLVWLDYPRHLVMWRVIQRTVSRRAQRAVMWNGNVEGPLWRLFTDKTHIVRWAWDTHAKTPSRVRALLAGDTHLVVVRLRGPLEAER
ncbi:MAG TPA: hypothetical protein VFD39_05140 [Trueperaceae bacterium]|nr:hypothetical protein [Trueperaceae bacterium]